ncbi:MAG: S26 family signal peptidase [Acidobacteria bacterium]|nr:S26 family signal peptidase [Acidobacteriota bacterium]
MRPSLNDQDVVIIEPSSAIVVGDIVLADHPFKNGVSILKRVVAIDDSGRFDLRGDNPNESSDSRSFGTVPALSIRGKAVCRLKSGS